MTKLILILSTTIIILSTLLGITYKQMRTQRAEAIRWENNYQQSQEQVSRVQMTLGEFKDYLDKAQSKEDSLLKELKIKPKQVEKIVYIENKYINKDTIEIELDLISGDELVSELEEQEKAKENYTLSFITRVDCLTVGGVLKTEDKNSELNLTTINYHNTHSYVAYWQRRQWKFLGIKTRLFGQKIGELEVTSTCGETTVREIDIIKKK